MRDLLRSLLERTDTTLILVTHSREDALDLARRVVVLERGEQVACDPMETALVRPRHVAVVRALGLGQIVEGEATALGEVETAFGTIYMTAGTKPGRLRLLVRPGQPRIVSDLGGVEAEVVSLELRPSETREVRRIAVVRVAGNLLRLIVRQGELCVGDSIRVQIEGECEQVEG
jgi:ABC-type sulfate/molybdate transport systems ATPase subunit